jgi:SAM-dependent methyltransferase
MLTISDPEIGPDELTRRGRAEAQRRQADAGHSHDGEGVPPRNPAAPTWASLHEAIAVAERHARIAEQRPPMTRLRGLRRRLALPLARLILRAAQLVTREQQSFNVETINALRALAGAFAAQVRALEQRIALDREDHRTRLEEVDRHRQALEEQLAGLQGAVAQASAAAEQRAGVIEQAVATSHQDGAARLEAAIRHAAAETGRLRTQLLLQERHVSLLLEEGQRRPRDPSANGRTASEELDHLLDPFYVSFEDHFRGTREDIRERASFYLPIIGEAGAGTADRPVLDVGCGRGEWLELLRDGGLRATGIDLNRAMVLESQDRGLDSVEADALTYLRGLPDRSYGAVTVIHLLEHLPFPVVIAILDEIVRVLQPGGVAVFETPNPQNLMVGACRFYIDPTHRNPLHADTMAFVAQARGLDRVQVRFLHPARETLPPDGSAVTRWLNESFFGPQDFAVIGYRA